MEPFLEKSTWTPLLGNLSAGGNRVPIALSLSGLYSGSRATLLQLLGLLGSSRNLMRPSVVLLFFS